LPRPALGATECLQQAFKETRMTAGRNHQTEIPPGEHETPATATLRQPSGQPALQVVAGAAPSRTPPFALALSWRKRQFLQRDQRSRPNARGKNR
jgi:hypothetical protein